VKVLVLPTQGGGVNYYRHHLPMHALRSRGHHIEALADGLLNWMVHCENERVDDISWLDEQLAAKYDAMWWGWSTNLRHVEMAVALRNKHSTHYLIDFDDDVANTHVYNVGYKHLHPATEGLRVVRMSMRVADALTTSTPPLVASLTPNCRHTHLLPNFTHPPHWLDLPRDPSRADDHSIRIMFAGGPSHLPDLELETFRHSIERVMERYDGCDGRPHVKLIFVCAMPTWAARWATSSSTPSANRAFYIHPTYNDARLWQRLITWVAPDIMVAPLAHNTFNVSKSLIKAYDAAMVDGCAFVCEDYPTYADIPADACVRVDSTTADNISAPGELAWEEALAALIEDATLRRERSHRLREWVLDCRTIEGNIHLWEAAFEEATSRPLVRDLSDIVRPRIYAPDGRLARDD